jgi:IS5 family transposase
LRDIKNKETRMEPEPWIELSAALSVVEHRWKRATRRDTYATGCIVRVYLWAVAHNAAVDWACRAANWPPARRPAALPDQSTMSRRMQRCDFREFLKQLEHYLAGRPGSLRLVKRIDGKPLIVAAHSKDPHARWGRGAGQRAKGYKLHAIWSDGVLPEQWLVTPLNVSESLAAQRMVKRLQGAGYLLTDKGYDANALFDLAAGREHQLVCPRRYGSDKGLGHHRHSPARLRSKDMLEGLTAKFNPFGRTLYKQRRAIEGCFGNATSFTGGLICLPPWVRTYPRVKLWVWGKLLLNAARIRCLRKKRGNAA